MISHVRVFSLLYREKDGFLHTFHDRKREYSFSVHPMAVLPLFFCAFSLFIPYQIGKDRMDTRSRRRCGNVRKLPAPAELWETCLQDVGKACPFPCAVNGFPIGASGSFPHFHDAQFYPAISRYAVNGTYRTATTSRHARTNPPITPPMIKFSANSAIPPPKEPPPGTIQRHIRWRPKGSPQSIQSHT